jgi:peptide-methionine (R)-S-oxide reductase
MNMHLPFFCAGLVLIFASACAQSNNSNTVKKFQVEKSQEEWLKELGPERFRILRQAGTEKPYSGELYSLNSQGVYACAGCENPLFTSNTKFDAHCGWPSFYQPVNDSAMVEIADYSHGMIRTEVRCGKCGGHLGHVFPDGPKPSGLRYCINSLSLQFNPDSPSK